jgi:hypothetical protein
VPRTSSEPATPKNDWVNEPGVNATRSSISVIITLFSISLLMVVMERGVSTALLPNPNTDSSGAVGITLMRSPSTTTVSNVSESLACAGDVIAAAARESEHTPRTL